MFLQIELYHNSQKKYCLCKNVCLQKVIANMALVFPNSQSLLT